MIIAPLAIIGALLFMRRERPDDRRTRIDVPGALLVASGMFLLVFALSEGGTYGWFAPLKASPWPGSVVWPATAPSRSSRSSSWSRRDPLRVLPLRTGQGATADDPALRVRPAPPPGFRYGLITDGVLAMGQLGLLFVLPVFLQDAKHLTAETQRALDGAGRHVHHRGRADRRPPDPPHRRSPTSCDSAWPLEALGLIWSPS